MNENKSRNLGWEDILAGLAQLNRENPSVLERNVLVGGAACYFYLDQLRQVRDPDFQPPIYGPEEELLWLSHDADFATTNPEEVPRVSRNMPLGTLQCGLAAIGAEEFRENARTVRLIWRDTDITMLMADPLDLWREKEAAIYRLSRPQDRLHLQLLELFLQWELAHLAEQVGPDGFSAAQWLARAKEVKMRCNSIFMGRKLRARLMSAGVPEIANFVTGLPHQPERD